MSEKVVQFESNLPHFVIVAGARAHVVPEMTLRAIADGKMAFSQLDDWEEIMQAVLKEWMEVER